MKNLHGMITMKLVQFLQLILEKIMTIKIEIQIVVQFFVYFHHVQKDLKEIKKTNAKR